MKIVPVLWTAHKSKDETYPVYIRVNIGQKRKLFPVGVKIKKSEWSNGRVRNRPNSAEYNLRIAEMIATIEKNHLDGVLSDGKKDSIFWWYDEFVKVCEAKHSTYHTKKMRNGRNRLHQFKSEISSKDLDAKFIRDYEAHLINEGLHKNYIADILKRLKFIITQMIDGGVIPYHKNPFNKVKIKYVKTEKERLPYEDILKLQKAKLSGDEKLARDMYIVSFYGGGIRFGDSCRLNKDNFKGSRLIYTMHKTNTTKNIPLNPVALKIMKSYNYSFPVGINWDKEDKSIASAGTRLRLALKEACRKAGVKPVTFHTSRHSIADYAVKKKISHKGIQGILGHKRSSTTEIYLQNFYQEETDEAMNKLFN